MVKGRGVLLKGSRIRIVFASFLLLLLIILSIYLIGNLTGKVISGDIASLLSAGLVFYYSFDDVSDGIVRDSSGNGNAATLVNGAAITPSGKNGNGMSLDGVDDYLSTPLNSLPQSFTVSAWYYSTNSQTSSFYKALFGKMGDGKGFWLIPEWANPSPPNAYFYLTNGTQYIAMLNQQPENYKLAWHHIAATYDGVTARLYLDGALIKEQQLSISNYDNNRPLVLGQRGDGVYNFKGSIDEVRVYNKALSQQEVTGLYSGSSQTIVGTKDSSISEVAPSDTGPPVISAISVSSLSSTSATLSWITDEVADSKIEYGKTSAYGMSQSSSNMDTYHQLVLQGLASGTTYHYRIISKDSTGNLRVSGDFSFTTSSAIVASTSGITTQASNELYVSNIGTTSGNGSKNNPWDLQTALCGGRRYVRSGSNLYCDLLSESKVKPGDILWLRGGTYKGQFFSVLNGTENKPIIVRGYPGEWAKIDLGADWSGGINILQGGNVWFWDLELYSTGSNRISEQPTTFPTDVSFGAGVSGVSSPGEASNIKLIHLVIHDERGSGLQGKAGGSEIYGSIIYYSGWDAPNRGHGHSWYPQNTQEQAVQRVTDNIMFKSVNDNLHHYSSKGENVVNFVVEGNILFGAGTIAKDQSGREVVIGASGGQAKNVIFKNNYIYGQSYFGYDGGLDNFSITDNYFINPGYSLGSKGEHWQKWALQFTQDSNLIGSYEFKNNVIDGYSYKLPDSKKEGNLFYHSGSIFDENAQSRTDQEAFVRPSKYEAGRAHIAVYNWDKKDYIDIDVSNIGLNVGDEYEIKDAENYFGNAIARGIYNGAKIRVPLNNTEVAPLIGELLVNPKHMGKDFGAFVIRKTAESRLPLPPALLTVGTPAINPNGGTFADSRSVLITSGTAGASIYYTLDGAVPTEQSSKYTKAITLTQTATLKAKAFKAGMNPSSIATAAFTKQAPVNSAPTVDAGNDLSVQLPNSASLSGSADDDGLPNGVLTSAWSKVSGPGSVNFGNTASLQTTVSFSTAGTYILRLTASDGTLSSSDNIVVNVAGACTLTSAAWGNSQAVDGDEVKLNLAGSDCDGKTVLFSVKEDDLSFGLFGDSLDDSVSIQPQSAVFANGVASSSWIAEWQEDCGGLCNPPEYYFTASIGTTNIRSNFLNVILQDTLPPARSNGLPSGELGRGTTSVTLSLQTGESATCKYSKNQNAVYNGMTQFAVTSGTAHSSSVTDLEAGNTYNYYVKCSDIEGNINGDNYLISFSIPAQQTYLLKLEKIGNGYGRIISDPQGIDCGADCNEDYNSGEFVTLTATASAGSRFDGWSQDCAGNSICNVVMDGARTARARFLLVNSGSEGNAVYSTEAEDAILSGSIKQFNDTNASGGKYVKSETGFSGDLTFNVNVLESGNYVIWARVLAPTANNDSFFVSIGGGDEDVYDAAEGTWSSEWQWTRVNGRGSTGAPVAINPRTFSLSAGESIIKFRAREPGTGLDKIIITNNISLVPLDLQEIEIIGTAETPAINPNGGTFADSRSVLITSGTAGASIYYTLDGAVPTEQSSKYTKAITLTQTATLKAKAFKAGMNPSSIAAVAFTKLSKCIGDAPVNGGIIKGPGEYLEVGKSYSWNYSEEANLSSVCLWKCLPGFKKQGLACAALPNKEYEKHFNRSDFDVILNKTKAEIRNKAQNKTLLLIENATSEIINKFNQSSVITQNESYDRAFVIIINLSLANSTKTIYVDKKDSNSNGVCIADRNNVTSLADISSDCAKLKCPGESEEYTCVIRSIDDGLGNLTLQYVVGGLKHSGVLEDNIEEPASEPLPVDIPASGGSSGRISEGESIASLESEEDESEISSGRINQDGSFVEEDNATDEDGEANLKINELTEEHRKVNFGGIIVSITIIIAIALLILFLAYKISGLHWERNPAARVKQNN